MNRGDQWIIAQGADQGMFPAARTKDEDSHAAEPSVNLGDNRGVLFAGGSLMGLVVMPPRHEGRWPE